MRQFYGLLSIAALVAASAVSGQQMKHAIRARLIVMADKGNEPDEGQQMAHMLMCYNTFDIEGLIAITGKYLRPEHRNPYRRVTHPELVIKLINAHAKVVPNLKRHASGWPDPNRLHGAARTGQKGYGIDDVDVGNWSPGSQLIIHAVTRDDPRPVWIVANAGSNTLAQVIVDHRAQHTPAEVDTFVAKLRVFENGAEGNAGGWICSEFPDIHWIRSNCQTCTYDSPGGLDGNLSSDRIIRLQTVPGHRLSFDASASCHPDEDYAEITRWQYAKAGTYPGQVHIQDPTAIKTSVVSPQAEPATRFMSFWRSGIRTHWAR